MCDEKVSQSVRTSTNSSSEQSNVNVESDLTESWFGFQDVMRKLRAVDLGLNETKSAASDRIRQTWDGITDVISTTATHLASELDRMEEDAQSNLATSSSTNSISYEGDCNKSCKSASVPEHLMPWEEVSANNTTTEDTDIKARVLQLSLKEDTFTAPYDQDDAGDVDDRFESTIRSNLLDLDSNLSRAYSKLVKSGTVSEELFWRNYFYHCEMIRSGKLFSAENDSKPIDHIIKNIPSHNSPKKGISRTTELDGDAFDYDVVKVEKSEVDEGNRSLAMPSTSSLGSLVFVGEASDDESA
eukprot:CAMPEP_0171299382 /NCGR_PEP_ID=MMETSP0816-20121228/8198_1 /TAXON_ID=420281 /ORGANISM="Proboscia inermis, Strain CCAP1064/1" /LENGTH=299 /DNA_ID=CAMNT_0011775133 /DNA_START=161 /DNA_END=1060 /DNA_ORIENTATION=-